MGRGEGRRGLEITCCLFRLGRKLEGVNDIYASETQTHTTHQEQGWASRRFVYGLAAGSGRPGAKV